MPGRASVALAALSCFAVFLGGCSGEKGAKITGVIVENGELLRVGEKDSVILSLVPTKIEEKSVKASPGADFKREDSTFTFVGPGLGLVPPGEYKVCLTVRPREMTDRYGGEFSPENTPLSYTVTDEPKQELVIDVKKKTITRK